ncbi:MAG: hypothetical protein HY288_04830 [Planctomycetia bacterium]|nr:hypothetical protein [Planctomycetia bacterium]
MPKPIRSRATLQTVETLAEQVRRIEAARRPVGEAVISSGNTTLDGLLPERGFRRGTLVEWLASGAGSGAATLALMAAREAARDGGALVVVDRYRQFYPPAAARLGIDLEKLTVVRPERDEDHAWAVDQVLRCPGVAAVWCAVGEQDDHTLRRWQLAAESSGVLGLLLRGEAARREPSWAELRLSIEPIAALAHTRGRNRRLRVELLRCRTGHAGGTVELEIMGREGGHEEQEHAATQWDTRNETRTMHLASQLAAAKARHRSRGA